MNIIQAIDDPKVFAPAFRDPASWSAWRAFLAALFGLPMNAEQRRLFRRCTGRKKLLKDGATEAWLICGRRGGKSFTLALIAVYLACFRDWRPFLAPGERATVMVLAADRKQARTIVRYVKGLLQSVPMLARTIEAERQEAIDLNNAVTVEVHTSSFRTVRGYSIVAALCDEIAFWRDDTSSNPDAEVIAALRPAMATVPGAMLLCASSPYARRGVLWNAHRKHMGNDESPVLVWQARSRIMNPTIPKRLVDDALADDPDHASSEWLAEFRSDIETFISREAIEAVISRGVYERAPEDDNAYDAFVDPSGGSGKDAMTLAIAHADGDKVVLDCIRERKPPFSPSEVVAEFASTLRDYRIATVRGDHYAGAWPREQFGTHGVTYETARKPKSDIYRDVLPVINSGRVDLLDNDKLITQFCNLERRTGRGGKDSIDHPPNAHDDVANAVAGVVEWLAAQDRLEPTTSFAAPKIIRVYDGPGDFGFY